MNETTNQVSKIRLSGIAHARSGDKGNHANVGVIAYTPAGFEYLKQTLTAEVVGDFFGDVLGSRVDRFELPGIHALNFLLYDALQGGASQSPRVDNQGKILALAILEMELPTPNNLAEMRPD